MSNSGGPLDARQCGRLFIVSAPSGTGKTTVVERLVQVHDHHDPGLNRDAIQRDVPDPHGYREVVTEPPLQHHAAGQIAGVVGPDQAGAAGDGDSSAVDGSACQRPGTGDRVECQRGARVVQRAG